MKDARTKLKELIRTEIQSVINEAKTRIRVDDDKGLLALVIGRYCRDLVAEIQRAVISEIGSQAGIKVNRDPTVLRGSAFSSLEGYSRSDIEAKAEISLIHIPNKQHVIITVQGKSAEGGRFKEEWTFSEAKNPSQELNAAASYIISTVFGY